MTDDVEEEVIVIEDEDFEHPPLSDTETEAADEHPA
jgi:hypothetical protein